MQEVVWRAIREYVESHSRAQLVDQVLDGEPAPLRGGPAAARAVIYLTLPELEHIATSRIDRHLRRRYRRPPEAGRRLRPQHHHIHRLHRRTRRINGGQRRASRASRASHKTWNAVALVSAINHKDKVAAVAHLKPAAADQMTGATETPRPGRRFQHPRQAGQSQRHDRHGQSTAPSRNRRYRQSATRTASGPSSCNGSQTGDG